MKKLGIIDFEILRFLTETPDYKLSAGQLFAKVGKRRGVLYASLDKLQELGMIARECSNEITSYCIPKELFGKNVFRRVKCPRCGWIKHVFEPGQVITNCDNPDCKTKSGKSSRFWIVEKKIVVDPGNLINCA